MAQVPSSPQSFPQVPVNQLFSTAAAAAPDTIAITEATGSITYAELERRSDILAGVLSGHGAGPDYAIGVHLPRSIDYIVGLLGILKSGSCYVPLDPAYPEERLKFIAADTACRVILSHSTNPSLGGEGQRLDLDRFDWQQAPLPVQHPAGLRDMAYILYTSGSTGTPKGVEIEHHNLTNLVLWHHATFPEPPHYHASQAARPGFDAAVWEIWSHLTRGATLHIIPDELLLQPPKLPSWLEQRHIAECFLPTPVAEMTLDAAWPEHSRLKYLHSGGDRLTRKPPVGFPGCLTNLYGPTECTVIATYAVFAPGEDDGTTPTIGRAVTNHEVRIVDADLKEVPPGGEGEICIGGAGVGRGYHRRPDLTAAVFVPDPRHPGAAMYLTGDLGIRRDDGNIDFIGRKDFQVKIRGLRIELGEIEAVISRHPDVRKCAVIARPGTGGGKFLAAYVVLKTNRDRIAEELRALTGEYLPDYMVPTTITVLDQMPLTVNGKIDRRALPEPERCGSGALDPQAQPQTESEKKLARIWEKLLHIEAPGVNDNFFLLGGHSLLATELCLEIQQQFQVALPLHVAFDTPVLRDMAARIAQSAAAPVPLPPRHRLRPRRRPRKYYPLSAEQLGMWTMEQTAAAGNLFNIPLVITLQGPVNPDLLEQAFNAIVLRHDVLRAGVVIVDGEPMLSITAWQPRAMPRHDLSPLDPEAGKSAWEELVREDRRLIFNLESPPLFMIRLVRFDRDNWKLLFTVHHLVFDGWSSTIFFRELAANYRHLSEGQKIATEVLQPDYFDFTLWQREYLAGNATESQMAYWRHQLAGMNPTPRLPFAAGPATAGQHAGNRRYLTLDADLTQRLNQLAVDNQATLFMVLTAALQTMLHRYTGAPDITSGTSIANRNHAETRNMIGLFINSLPLRNSFAGHPSFPALLRRIRATTLEAGENQDVPFEKIIEELKPDNPVNPMFRVSLLLQNLPYGKMNFSGIRMSYDEIGNNTSKLDILITFEERGEELYGWFEYNAALFSAGQMEQMAAAYAGLLRQVTENPNRIVTEYRCPCPDTPQKTCYLAGETSMVPRCIEILQQNGIVVLGVFTPDDTIRHEVRKHQVPCYEQNNPLMREILSIRPFDYLFSVINSMVLGEDILALPQGAAINYHDAPLPRYAGMYASSWAIINGEKSHGVTWHEMAREVDAGAILIQRPLAVAPEETSVSLNLKCTETALQAFRELVPELAAGQIRRQPQDPTRRTYYGLYRRPPCSG
ncbi:MAG: amino acid adenylation domain-containing protein, partial [Victivallales bacterium]|nr:amino acid adenylation domain-containing protein [Victivallales bacterium]